MVYDVARTRKSQRCVALHNIKTHMHSRAKLVQNEFCSKLQHIPCHLVMALPCVPVCCCCRSYAQSRKELSFLSLCAAMDAPRSTPRVNGAMLRNFIGGNVRIVGRVGSVQGSQVQLEASDGVHVLVHRQAEAFETLDIGSVVEVIGKVLDERSVEAFNLHFLQLGSFALVCQKTNHQNRCFICRNRGRRRRNLPSRNFSSRPFFSFCLFSDQLV